MSQQRRQSAQITRIFVEIPSGKSVSELMGGNLFNFCLNTVDSIGYKGKQVELAWDENMDKLKP